MQNGYHVYLKKCLLPVAPSKIQVKVNSQDKTVSLINDGGQHPETAGPEGHRI